MGTSDDLYRIADRYETYITQLFRNAVKALTLEFIQPVQQGGRLPYRTGNLQRSLWVSTSGMAMIDGSREKFDDMQDFFAAIDAAKLGDTVYIALRAAYAYRMNYGFVGEDSLGRFYNQAGYGFRENAAMRWPAILAEQRAAMGSPW